jgi:predicted transcriptional regulator
MTTYIPKQVKRTRERVEAKLDRELIEQLDAYCVYLDSDRDYIIGQALEIAFKKDKEFMEQWRNRPRSAGK